MNSHLQQSETVITRNLLLDSISLKKPKYHEAEQPGLKSSGFNARLRQEKYENIFSCFGMVALEPMRSTPKAYYTLQAFSCFHVFASFVS